MSKMNRKVQRMTVSGIMLALATVLSFVTVYRLPYGGGITLLSMLPLVMLGYMYGKSWGLLCGFAYGIIQAILGAAMSSAFAGQKLLSVAGILLLDYIVAFSVLGLAGMFKGFVKNHTVAFAAGTFVATLLRYAAHIASGAIFFGSYAEWFFTQETTAAFGPEMLEKYSGTALFVVYSLIYNGTYMVPEIILTTVFAVVLITAVKPLRAELIRNN